MASTDNGKQIITFRYQQEGTAEGFNKLLSGVIPTGIISGGELSYTSGSSSVNIAKMQMMIGDGNVVVHVQTTEVATVGVSLQQPYIIATFNWANLTDNFVTFESSAYNTLPTTDNAIILGKAEFNGNTIEGIDYTRRTWSSTYLNNDFLYDNTYKTKSPSFNVTYREDSTEDPQNIIIGFNVGKGRGIINGVEVNLTTDSVITLTDNDTGYHRINKQLTNSRIDIAVLMPDKSIRYIMGEDSIVPTPPKFPSYGLTLAEFTYRASDYPPNGIITYIKGSNITNLYNNNFISNSPTIGVQKAGSVINSHTLYL